MSLKIRQANYFCEAKILLSSAIAGLLQSITTYLFHDSVKSTALKHTFLPVFSKELCKTCNLCIL